MKPLLYDTIFNQIPESMVILDTTGQIFSFNQVATKYEHLAHRPLEKGVKITDIIPKERKEIVNYIIKEVTSKGIPQTCEALYMDRMGRPCFFEATYSPLFDENNQLSHICIVFREITHQKTFEKRVVELVQEHSNLIENAKAIIFSVDSRAYITEWNKECARTTGYDKNEILAQKISKLINESYQVNFSDLYAKVLNGEAISNHELLVKTKNGDTLTMLVNATPKINSSKSVVGILFVGQDITELSSYRHSLEEKVKDRTEQLREALEKEKELVEIKNRFISVASHEFKVPLSSIGTSTNYVKANPNLRKEDLSKLENIEKQVSYMKSLLEDVLALKKVEANALKANYNYVEVIPFLSRLIEEVLETAAHSHRVVTSFPEQNITIESDEKLLRNIFVNLISNAIKFSPGKDHIELSVKIQVNKLEITINDQGIGIPEADIHKIFEPFNRGSNAENIKGTGLGMSIVKKAVETLGGTMQIQSTPSIGTSVTTIFNLTTIPRK